ncbi:MAG: DUF63 family protein [Candidatus Micrarchaeota archaeon]|nr:DUF63 family protein [Candidatus Micrarchaeota archaeon]
MDIAGFFEEYYIRPIVMHEGYNPINTLTYAIIAVIAAFLIYKLFKGAGVRFDKDFIMRVVPYVLLGSAIRVVTDSITTGGMQAYSGIFKPAYDFILASHIYDYGFLTTSPGIFFVIGFFAIVTMYYSYRSKNYDFGAKLALGLFIAHLIILLPLFTNVVFGLLILLLAGMICALYLAAKRTSTVPMHWLVVFSQALDGSATFVTLDIYNKVHGGGYVEQHVLANHLASIMGGSMILFLALKVVLAVMVVWILEKEKDEGEKGYIALLIIIFGLAPGVRDLLRLVCGV